MEHDPAVKYLFLMGSRLWGTSRPNSDYDYYAVLFDNQKIKKSPRDDVVIKTYTEWLEDIQNGIFIATVTLFLPKEKIIKGLQTDYYQTISKLKPNYQNLEQHLRYRRERDLNYACKNTAKNKLDRAKKTMFHSYITQTIGNRILRKQHNDQLLLDLTIVGNINNYQDENEL